MATFMDNLKNKAATSADANGTASLLDKVVAKAEDNAAGNFSPSNVAIGMQSSVISPATERVPAFPIIEVEPDPVLAAKAFSVFKDTTSLMSWVRPDGSRITAVDNYFYAGNETDDAYLEYFVGTGRLERVTVTK